jgi:FAD/FMN-containing dehydrogenase
MKADGQIVRCTPTENADLFGLALGGYGLFGVILDAELRVVPNERYETRTSVVTVGDFSAAFRAQIADERVEMAYGRLCVAPGDEFLREGMITVFRKAPCPREEIPQLAPPRLPWLRRALFRAQIGSDAGKVLRWTLEKKIGEQVSARYLSRNQLFYESARVYTERNVDRVDVLQESFVPIRRFAEFVERVRAALARHPADLLNVTVREVARDDVTFLRYADDEMMAVVMLFDEERTAAGDRRMQELAGDLIDAALACDGRYYLPYRLDATREQFERAYPMARDWADRKGRYDPQDLFENLFFTRYAGR